MRGADTAAHVAARVAANWLGVKYGGVYFDEGKWHALGEVVGENEGYSGEDLEYYFKCLSNWLHEVAKSKGQKSPTIFALDVAVAKAGRMLSDPDYQRHLRLVGTDDDQAHGRAWLECSIVLCDFDGKKFPLKLCIVNRTVYPGYTFWAHCNGLKVPCRLN